MKFLCDASNFDFADAGQRLRINTDQGTASAWSRRTPLAAGRNRNHSLIRRPERCYWFLL